MVVFAALSPSPARAQGTLETVFWAGNVTGLGGTGNGLTVGSVVTGSFTINPSSLTYTGGDQGPNGAAFYTYANSTITDDGVISTQNLGVLILNNCLDSAQPQHPADAMQFTWNGGNNDLVVDFPVSSAPDCTPASIQALLNQGLAGSLPYSADAFFDVFDVAGINGGGGNLTSFMVISPPGPALSIRTQTDTIILTWPTNFPSFNLQASKFLGTNWTTITNQPAIAGTNYLLEFSATNTTEFFRLCSTNN